MTDSDRNFKQIEEGRQYRDRTGTVWLAEQHSVYDAGWTWAKNLNDTLPGLFYRDGSYLPPGQGEHDFDLIEELK